MTRTTENTCGYYSIKVKLNYGKSIIEGLTPDEEETTLTVTDANNLVFNSVQAGLSGIISYDVSIIVN